MKKATEDDMREEYDFRGGVRGKYAARHPRGTNVVVIAPDLAEIFRDSETVDHALRQYLADHGAPPNRRN